MKPYFRKAGNPASHTRNPGSPQSRIPGGSAGGDRARGLRDHQPAAGDFYDNAAPAVQTVDPPARSPWSSCPAAAAARPIAACGETRRARARQSDRSRQPGKRGRPESSRCATASLTRCRSTLDSRALYQVYTAVGQITDIALQPGEQLVGAGPWPPATQCAGSSATPRADRGNAPDPHPSKAHPADLMTNLVINTNMRTYHMELRSTERTYMASVSWRYPQDQLIALRRQNAEAQAAQPVASGVDLANVNFRYAIEGDRAPWRPLRAFDDGRRSLSSFRAASVRARCRHSSSSAPRATPLSS